MVAPADFSQDDAGGTTVLRFTGNLSLAHIGDLPQRLDAVDARVGTLDLSQVDQVDTIGAWVVHRFARDSGARIEGLSEEGQHLLGQVEKADQPVRMRPDHTPAFQRVLGEIGDATITALKTLAGLLGFFGATLIAFWNVIRNPGRFRLNAVVTRFDPDRTLRLDGPLDFDAVTAQQDAAGRPGAEGAAVRIDGRFASMRVRSVPRQRAP